MAMRTASRASTLPITQRWARSQVSLRDSKAVMPAAPITSAQFTAPLMPICTTPSCRLCSSTEPFSGCRNCGKKDR